jgi:hypothetical protein
VAGVKLDNNTENTKHSERWRKTRSVLWLEWNSTTTQETRNKANGELNDVNTCKNVKLWLEWNSTTTQETRNKPNGELNDVKTYDCSEITNKRKHCEATKLYCNDNNEANDAMKRRQIRRIFENSHENEEYHGHTVAGAELRQQHRSTKPEKKPSWNVCSNGHNTAVMNWQYAGLRVRSKSSGLPIVGDSKHYTRQ